MYLIISRMTESAFTPYGIGGYFFFFHYVHLYLYERDVLASPLAFSYLA